MSEPHTYAGHTLDEIKAAAEAATDAARLEGFRAAQLQALGEADMVSEATDCEQSFGRGQHNGAIIVRECIRAMQPPAEWQCAEVKPVCGAAPSITPDSDMPVSLCTTCIRANVSCPVYPLYTLKCVEYVAAAPNNEWAHPDGFAGGLTERACDGQGQEG